MVFFVTGPKYSGKTTRLREILGSISGAAGFITEKVYSGNEVSGYDIRNLKNGELWALARRKGINLPENWGNETVHGDFRFSLSTLEEAEHIVDQAIEEKAPAIFIDELGKLELRKDGHFRAIRKALDSRADVYIAIRDINLGPAVKLYGIKEHKIIKAVHGQ